MKTGITSRQVLEFRSDNSSVSISGTAEGLTWLAQKCFVLVDAERRNHFHLADYFVLTAQSQNAVLELLPDRRSLWERIVNQGTKFTRPDFSQGNIEFTEYAGELHIYGTLQGLAWLARKCLVLVDTERPGQIRFEDFGVLPRQSKRPTLAFVSQLPKATNEC